MEKIKEELKLMQTNPNFNLANYFHDLKGKAVASRFPPASRQGVFFTAILACPPGLVPQAR